MACYVGSLREPKNRPDIERTYCQLRQCASYLVFNDYFTIEEQRLVKAHTCKQHLLCPFCAMRRSGKFVALNLPKLQTIINENPSKIPAMITLTVKNGESLPERFTHLKNAHKRLTQRRRDSLKGKSSSEWANLAGGITSYEFTKADDGGWHPHIHCMALLNDYIDQKALSEEWHEITGDSFIVDVRKVRPGIDTGALDIVSALLEVCKYALKFHDMTLPDTWHAYEVLRRRRLVNSFGILRGVAVPDELLDDPLEGLPYLERHYRFSTEKRAYDLLKITHSDDLPPVAV